MNKLGNKAKNYISQNVGYRGEVVPAYDHYIPTISSAGVMEYPLFFTNNVSFNPPALTLHDEPFLACMAVYGFGGAVATAVDLTACSSIPSIYRQVYLIADYPFRLNPYAGNIDYDGPYFFIPEGATINSLVSVTYVLSAVFHIHPNTNSSTYVYSSAPVVSWYLGKTYYGTVIQNASQQWYAQRGVNNTPNKAYPILDGFVNEAVHRKYILSRSLSSSFSTTADFGGTVADYNVPNGTVKDTTKRLINMVALDTQGIDVDLSSHIMFYQGFIVKGFAARSLVQSTEVALSVVIP